jgi:hypothetical protein
LLAAELWNIMVHLLAQISRVIHQNNLSMHTGKKYLSDISVCKCLKNHMIGYDITTEILEYFP